MSVIAVLPEFHEFSGMETREAPPAHLLVKIESFSLFEKYQIEKYETKEFAAGKYKWKLIIYPNGDGNIGKDSGYVSVYLAMVDTCSQPVEVNAVFSIFLFNHISGKYLSSLGRTRRFLGTKSKWGFSKFISKESLTDPSNGYVVGDKSCVFGAEVFVAKKEAITQFVSSRNVDVPYKRDWIIPNYSKLGLFWVSEEFGAGGEK
ncbi:PREDICTED: ubiquitin carboxyl-terminal hydrolase 12-like, partial [Erythranthe guttata]|uniref:ubiquitin carboxyl-terminal hydrolase 12-like n=1 Tax=Erythranthe guttata TaxID=4155 RepID=UPI00064DC544